MGVVEAAGVDQAQIARGTLLKSPICNVIQCKDVISNESERAPLCL